MTDQEFARDVEECHFPLKEFNHHHHVRLAWIYLRRHELCEAIMKFRETLKRFAAHHGKGHIYHETITFTYMLLVHEGLRRHPGLESWDDFAAANPELLNNGKGILARLYKNGSLESEEARKFYRLPDAIMLGLE